MDGHDLLFISTQRCIGIFQYGLNMAVVHWLLFEMLLTGLRLKAYTQKIMNGQGINTSHLKKRILIQDQGGAGFQTGGILVYVEDLKPGSNKDIGPKDFFETACRKKF